MNLNPTSKKILWISLILLLVVLFGWQNLIELRAEEPRRAIVSLEMMINGDYVIPRINGWSYYNKPPLFNWIMIGFFYLFGSFEEWVVRLPSLLSIISLGVLHYFFSKKYFSKQVALFSSFAYVTAAEVLWYGSINSAEIDPLYSLVVYGQLIAIFHFYQQKKFWNLYLVSYLLVFIGFMLKGIPSLAFQALTILGMAAYYKDWRLLFKPAHFAGIILLFGLGFSYFYAYSLQDDWIGFLVRQYKEAAQRTGLETDFKDTLSQSLAFPFQMLKLLLPWSLLVLIFFQRGSLKKIGKNPFIVFAWIFIISNIWIYWISGDFKPRYYYMFFPFLLTLIFYAWEQLSDSSIPLKNISLGIMGVVMSLVALLLFALPFFDGLELIPNLVWRSSILGVLATASVYAYWKWDSKFASIVLFMAISRLALNLLYLPSWNNDPNLTYYREAVSEVLKITGDEPVYLSGSPYVFSSDASLGPLKFGEVVLETAPIINYNIPYYLTRSNGHIMQFTETLIPGNYYLLDKNLVDTTEYEILYYVEDWWKKKEYALIKP